MPTMRTVDTSYSDLARFIEGSQTNFVMAPLPANATPVGGAPLASISDDLLLKASPALLSHIIRTAANGGMQVLGPENIPASGLLSRVLPQHRQSDLIIAGSVANTEAAWPTFDDVPIPAHLVPDPFTSRISDISVRGETKSTPVARTDLDVTNPVAEGLVAAAGVVALQGVAGVAGDSEALADVLDASWGLEAGTIDELSLRVEGPSDELLRYVIRSDRVRPTVSMPLHLKKTISVAFGAATRADYGANASFDWNRARSVAEFVLYTSWRLEGVPAERQWSGYPPGDMAAPVGRKGILVFQPGPLSVMSYPTESVRVYVSGGVPRSNLECVQEVMGALNRFLAVVSAPALVRGKATVRTMVTSRAVHAPERSTNVISRVNTELMSVLTGQLARGRKPTAVISAALFTTMRAAVAPSSRPTMLTALALLHAVVEYKDVKKSPVKIPDRKLRELLTYALAPAASYIRSSVAAEAGRNRETLDSWYDASKYMLPEGDRGHRESSIYWVRLAAHDMVAANSDSWRKMKGAAILSVVRGLVNAQFASLPAVREDCSPLELLYAMSSYCTISGRAWSAYYHGTARAAWQLAKEVEGAYVSKVLKLASYLWEFRSRMFSALKVAAYDHMKPNPNAVLLKVAGCDAAFEVYSNCRRAVAAFNGNVKRLSLGTKLSSRLLLSYDTKWVTEKGPCYGKSPLVVVTPKALADNRVYRYVTHPGRLFTDLVSGLTDVSIDLQAYANSRLRNRTTAPPVPAVSPGKPAAITLGVQPAMPVPTQVYDGWAAIADLENGADLYELAEESLDMDVLDGLMASVYEDAEEFSDAVYDALDQVDGDTPEAEESNVLS